MRDQKLKKNEIKLKFSNGMGKVNVFYLRHFCWYETYVIEMKYGGIHSKI